MFPSPFARLFGMVSAPFATNNTVTKGTKLSENRTVIKKLSFATPGLCRLIFDYCGAIFALPESLFIDYSGAKYVRSALKIALTWKSLFRVVENGKFLNRLLNGHLEKSAVTGVYPPHVHQ